MKRLFVIGTCAALLGLVAATGCQKDNPSGQEAVKSTDDANYLQSQLVFLDQNGDVEGYMTGFGLNEADPGEVSIHCETLEEARSLFESWLPQDAAAFRNGESVIWDMTDTLGVSQGRAVLVPGGEKGSVAHLELPATFPGVTSVQFKPQASMPQNSELDVDSALEEYYFLNTVYFSGRVKNFHGSGDFVVIREYDQDTNTSGIILSCQKKEWNTWTMNRSEKDGVMDRCRTLSELRIVGGVYRQFSSQINGQLSSIGCASGNNKFFCVSSKADDDWGNAKRYNLNDWEPETVNGFQPTFQEAWVYFFNFEKKGDGYKLVFK